MLLAKLEPKRQTIAKLERNGRTYVRTYVRTHNCRVPILSVLSFGFSDLNAHTPYVTVRQMSERSPRAPAKSAHVRAYLLNQASARVRT